MIISYTSKAWLTFRASVFKRDLFCCQMCGVPVVNGKRSRRAAVGEHLRPARLRPELFLDPENVWTVCKRCHDGECASIESRLWPDADAIFLAKVCFRPIGPNGYPMNIERKMHKREDFC